jgi:hypothetical protein
MRKFGLVFALLLTLTPFKANAVQYQGSPIFIINGSGSYQDENWVPKRLLIDGSPKERIEVKINSVSQVTLRSDSRCNALFIPIDEYKNLGGKIKVDGQEIDINTLPTNGNSCSYWGWRSPRPVNFITRPDASKSGRFLVVVNLQPNQDYTIEIPQQVAQVVQINACGFGFINERRSFKRNRWGEIVEAKLISLPQQFTLKNQSYTLSQFPTASSNIPPVCRVNRTSEGDSYVPLDW